MCVVCLFLTKPYLSHKFKCFPACTLKEAVEYISHIFGSVQFFFSVELTLIFCLALLNHVLCVAVFFSSFLLVSTAFGWSEDFKLSFFILVRKMHYGLLSRFLD